MPKNRFSTTLLLMALVAAPAAWTGQFDGYEPHGFLSDYSKLKPEGGGSHAYKYRDPKADEAKYKKVMIDSIKIYLKDDAKSKEIDPTQLKELADYFHSAIVEAMKGGYSVVTEPGPDVLRLRIGITDLVPNKPDASVVTLAVLFLRGGEAGAAEGKTGSTPFIGEVTIEMEALDSDNHKQVAAYIETDVEQLEKK